MIVEYHRPQTIEAALELLARTDPVTLPMGGGTVLTRGSLEPIGVVDLQALGLNGITREGNAWRIGATAKLEQIFECPELPPALRNAAGIEESYNLRQVSTLAGLLASCDGRSPVACTLLALDARLTWMPGEDTVNLGDWLPVRGAPQPGKLIVHVSFPAQAALRFESVSRTPDDRPIVCAAVAQWPSGRTRLALGGYGAAPVLAMDGPEAQGIDQAAGFAYRQAEDAWASAEYRRETAAALAKRCLE